MNLAKIHKEINRELRYCYKCDCETYPYCSIDGHPCPECFDLYSFSHKSCDKHKLGMFIKTQSSRLQKQIKIVDPYIQIIATDPNGDCLYKCLSEAFLGKISVKNFRNLVAQNQSIDTFQAYKTLAENRPEYSCVKAARTLRQFKNLIQRLGRDIGVNQCLWGDENALQIISNVWHISFKIFNEKGYQIQSIIPEHKQVSRIVLLRLNQSEGEGVEHYSLMFYNNHTVLTQFEWKHIKYLLNKMKPK